MQIQKEELFNKRQTVQRIFDLVRSFKGDLNNVYIQAGNETLPVSRLSLAEFFDLVRSIPYKRDSEPVEVVARRKIIFKNYLSGLGKDCKKAAILIGSYLEIKKVPWRLATVSTRPDRKIHHIFPQANFGSGFVNLDATYGNMRPFDLKRVTKVEYFE